MTRASIPYPLSGVGNVFQIRTRRDYYQIEWPLRTRRYEYASMRMKSCSTFFRPRSLSSQHRERLTPGAVPSPPMGERVPAHIKDSP